MNIAIILAAGKSQRAGQNKLWANVYGRPLWTMAFEAFAGHDEIDKIILLVPAGDESKFVELCGDAVHTILPGGESRMESFRKGLSAANPAAEDIIIDHNAANPNVTADEISQVIAAAKEHGAAAVSHCAVDTLIRGENGFYTQLVDREDMRLMQTPQAVRADILAAANLDDETDLASALLKTAKVKILDASPENKKVTFAEDIDAISAKSYIGEDSHQFGQSGTLMLGGIQIPDCPATEANSDGDVILHAIGRALAQAQNGSFSEVADKLCEGGELSSAAYLRPLLRGIKVQNVSLQIEGKRPRIDRHAPAIKKSLAQILSVPADQIHIAAMTGEGLTSFGRGEGIRCICILNCSK